LRPQHRLVGVEVAAEVGIKAAILQYPITTVAATNTMPPPPPHHHQNAIAATNTISPPVHSHNSIAQVAGVVGVVNMDDHGLEEVVVIDEELEPAPEMAGGSRGGRHRPTP
jgi:hypothetical protein